MKDIFKKPRKESRRIPQRISLVVGRFSTPHQASRRAEAGRKVKEEAARLLAEERWIAEACLREEAARKAACKAEKEAPQMMARFTSLELVLTIVCVINKLYI